MLLWRCRQHLKLMGLTPTYRNCKHEGCEKWANRGLDGQYTYCIMHMRERGLKPKVAPCLEPECGRRASKSTDGR